MKKIQLQRQGVSETLKAQVSVKLKQTLLKAT